ncbi:unnamed protein product, partial [Urochloa humidicola]
MDTDAARASSAVGARRGGPPSGRREEVVVSASRRLAAGTAWVEELHTRWSRGTAAGRKATTAAASRLPPRALLGSSPEPAPHGFRARCRSAGSCVTAP